MAHKIRDVRHRRSGQIFPVVESFFQRQLWPARLALLVAAFLVAILLSVAFFSYGSKLYTDSLPAYYILAEAAEKQNLEEAVSWRAQIARLLPRGPDSQLNLASAALRFGKLDLARKALGQVASTDRDSAAFHVVAGWLARAEGNFAAQQEQFAT